MSARRQRLALRGLERRVAPAAFTVTALTDAGTGSGSAGDLRYCITQLNASPDPVNTIDATGVAGTVGLKGTLPTISKPVTLVGPGSGNLIVTGSNGFRVFDLANGPGALPVSITGLTVFGGKAATNGGGIALGDDVLTLRDVRVVNCSTGARGGGIFVGQAGTLIMDGCTVTGCTGGGLHFFYGGRFDIRNSTISGNARTSKSSDGGGALYFFGAALGGACVIQNSTISGNSATIGFGPGGGGGIRLYFFSGRLDIDATTITNNSTNGTGGGLSAAGNFTTAAVVNVRSSIVEGNKAGVSPDLSTDGGFSVVSVRSAYGANPATNGAAKFTGSNDLYGAALNLQPLAANGGPTQTVALGAGSAAIDAGFNAGPAGTDGRGPTFARKVGTVVDIGAFEFGAGTGEPTASTPNLTLAQPGGMSQTVSVLFADDTAIDTASLGGNDLRVTGPGGYDRLASFGGFSLDPVLGAKRVTAVYEFPANSAGVPTWEGSDNGVYAIAVEPMSVLDDAGKAVTADAIATLTVNLPAPTAKATAPDVIAPQIGGAGATVTLTYSYQVPIAFATLGDGDVRVTGPGGYNQAGTFLSATPGSDSTTIVARYAVTAPGGNWDANSLGTYVVAMEPGQVTSTDGVSVPAGPVTVFRVVFPVTLVVNSAADEATDTDGKLSLREALLRVNANAAPAADTVTFDPAAFPGAATVTLSLGEVVITDAVTIQGPGSGTLTLSAGAGARHINVNDPSPNGAKRAAILLSGLRLAGGAPAGPGGSLLLTSTDELVNLTDVVFEGNKAAGDGGAIQQEGVSGVLTSLTIDRCRFLDNTAALSGGAINQRTTQFPTVTTGGQLTISNTTFENNMAGIDAGAVAASFAGWTAGGKLLIEACTFANNRAGDDTGSGGFGGALVLRSAAGPNASAVVRNSTFSGNRALAAVYGRGAAIYTDANFSLAAGVAVQNCTLVFNQTRFGGALARAVTGGGSINLVSCIVFHNVATQSAAVDLSGGDFSAQNCIIFNASGAKVFVNKGGNQFGAAADPLITALADFGGPTRTHGLIPGSPALEKGSNPSGLPFDQRGSGFPRVLGPAADVGAFESIPSVPVASAVLPETILTAGPLPDTIQVTYSDPGGIDVSTIDPADISMTGPDAKPLTVLSVAVTPPGNGTPRTAKYTFAVPVNAAAGWDTSDNGLYTVALRAGQVFNVNGDPGPAIGLGQFRVEVPGLFVVNEASDVDDGDIGPGHLSFREAVRLANADGIRSVIAFDQAVFGPSSKSITMIAAEYLITGTLEILGPSHGVTLDAGGKSRVFKIDIPGAGAFSASNLTMTNGAVIGHGGAVLAGDDDLSLTGCTLSNCQASESGGAVAKSSSTGTLTLIDCTVTGNHAGLHGGGVSVYGTLVMTGCTVSGNTAANAAGGGLSVRGPASTITNCTFSGNNALSIGGAIDSNASTKLANCTITGNSANSGGGVSNVLVMNSTVIAGNLCVVDPQFNDIYAFSGAVLTGDNNLIGVLPAGLPATGTGNLTGSATAPLNAKLAPLADNGGPTQTHALLPDSPAINAGNNAASMTTDQRGPGYFRVVGGQADIGAFEVQVPHVIRVTVNDGSAQRSRVTGVTVEFDAPVTLPGNAAAAFGLRRQSDNAAVGLIAAVSGRFVSLSFTAGPVEFGSLADGRYTLTVFAAQVNGGNFDGNGDGTVGDDFVLIGDLSNKLVRLFGDTDGDGDVDAADYGAFRGAFGTAAQLEFDFDGDGDVDAVDFGQFRIRFGGAI